MALPGTDTQLPPIALPYDLSSMNVNYTLQTGVNQPDRGTNLNDALNTVGNFTNTDGSIARIRLSQAIVMGLPKPVAQVLSPDQTIHIGGMTGRIVDVLSIRSLAGKILLMDFGGRPVVLKIAKNDPGNATLRDVLAESIIQRIVYESTRYGHDDCPYTLELYGVGKLRLDDQIGVGGEQECLGILMEYAPSPDWLSINDRFLTFYYSEQRKDCLVRVARILQNLQQMYNFQHGDLHFENAFTKGNTVRLIDFGRSQITIGGLLIRNETYLQNNFFGEFDMTYLASSLVGLRHIQRARDPIVDFLFPFVGDRNPLGLMMYYANHNTNLHWGTTTYFQSGHRCPNALPVRFLSQMNPANAIQNREPWCRPMVVALPPVENAPPPPPTPPANNGPHHPGPVLPNNDLQLSPNTPVQPRNNGELPVAAPLPRRRRRAGSPGTPPQAAGPIARTIILEQEVQLPPRRSMLEGIVVGIINRVRGHLPEQAVVVQEAQRMAGPLIIGGITYVVTGTYITDNELAQGLIAGGVFGFLFRGAHQGGRRTRKVKRAQRKRKASYRNKKQSTN